MASNDGENVLEASGSSGHVTNEAPTANPTVPLQYKTISCTQCRKRKLKCDRGKPSCGTCSRLHHQCVYPEGRIKSTTKRRNVKDLEARLAQVETLLGSEAASKLSSRELPIGNSKPETYPATGTGNYWDDLEIDMIMGNGTGGAANQSSGPPLPTLLEDQYFPNELIGFGLQENLPSQHIMDELHNIYFDRIHASSPVVHKYRYLANVHLLPPLGPPICLRYAVWAMAAASSEKYSNHQEVFYQRARKYAEADEMKGRGEHFVTVSHAQCWSMLSEYEARNMYLSRAWVSAGKGIRLVQMMNLHRLDGGGEKVKQIIAPPKDWMELEERRRTFWSSFCCDRYSCAGTGWPMTIDERDITTHLPASEEAFEHGQTEVTMTLSEAMTAEGAARVSPYAGVVLMACLFGHNWLHLHRPGQNDRPENYLEGEFWKRHRRMDNVLSNTFMFLPERLRLPGGLHDPNIVYLNMNIHASTICLHQTAILKAEMHGLDHGIIRQSQARCRVAAQEIVNIMRLISHFDVAEMNTWVSFNLYIATSVLIEGCHSVETSQESRSNLDFLLTALQAISRKHVVTQAFIAQLKIDLEIAGIGSPFGEISTCKDAFGGIGRPAIYASDNHGATEFSSNLLHQSIFSTGHSSSASGGSESCNTSDKDSATPPQNPNSISDMLGVLPKQGMDMRLRRAKNLLPFKISNQPEQTRSYGVPTTFNIPSLLGHYGIPGKPEVGQQQNHQAESNSSGQTSSFSSAFPYPQQFMQTANNGENLEKPALGTYSDVIIDGVPSNWAFGSVDNPLMNGLSGFEFFLQEGEDVNSLLNGTAWDASSFQA